MAMLYISHADDTERMARIERVKQSIVENQAVSSVRITKITHDLDKGKGHVFAFPNHAGTRQLETPREASQKIDKHNEKSWEYEAESDSSSAQALLRRGESPGTRARANHRGGVPPSWKRKENAKIKSSIPAQSPSHRHPPKT
ncbi:unnamed protein product [Eruca vesicaria subsp. sativa]|uniref:Uncharacterized protein n=1 Tax=Eruca vesicaria subsp. sativa TaxID=29727 RepID=A0ABC8M9T3_ERUVS|nr:unnamed protein product [Eruca vesicaria subsp. sativa]